MADHGGQSWTRKLSPEANRLVSAIAADQRAGHTVSHQDMGETDALVRTSRKISTVDRTRLESAGATVRSVAGDVLTARIPVRRLEALARLDFVVYVELSRPLSREHQGPTGEGG